MRPRDPAQSGRVASSLELFFDLVFVVAVSVAGSQLHHAFAHGQFLHGVTHFAMVFFAIWWAWMNFTWFATSFDTDDWLYRVLTVLQMGGVLVLAAGIPAAFNHDDFRVIVLGYVIMRLAMCSQWWRAAAASPEYRATAGTYALAIFVVQAAWAAFLLVPDAAVAPIFVLLVAAELATPVLAERHRATPWHAHHITERYGAFTLIVLGESLLASTNALVHALEGGEHVPELISVGTLVLVVTAGLWWIYFWPPHHDAIGGVRETLRYGYTHYLVFAGAAAFSAGVELEIDRITGATDVGAVPASFTVTVPIALFLVAVWWVAIRSRVRAVDVAVLGGSVLVLCDFLVPVATTWTAVVVVAIVATMVRHPAPDSH